MEPTGYRLWLILDVLVMIDHEFSVYSRDLSHFRSNGGKDLLLEIKSKKAFLLDNNTPAFRVATENPELNFLIGITATNECENFSGTFLKEERLGVASNLFLLTSEVSEKRRCYVIHRFDRSIKEIFGSMPKTLSDLDPEEIERFNPSFERLKTLEIVKELSGVPEARIIKQIRGERISNSPPYHRSINIAIRAFVMHLKHSKKRRKEMSKIDSNHPNTLGDTFLIQEALLTNLSVVSSDSDVHSIGSYAGVTVRKPEQVAAGNDR
jgi:hypothetical protein